MNIKIKFPAFLTALLLSLSMAQITRAEDSQLLWMQQPSVSPDGKWIAFESMGNLFKVSTAGGTAIPLTFNSYYNGYPVWSRDGKKIAFASNRFGNFDIFTIPASGGASHRITFDSSKDIPYEFSADDKDIYFGTERHDSPTSLRFPSDRIWMKLYKVSVEGGRNIMVNSAGTEYVHFNKKGDSFLFQDRKGYEDNWRKHHVSPITRDIWLYENNKKSYTKLSDFEGEDREPVWGKDDVFYYLSERNGNQNLFRSSINQPATVTQLTNFIQNPVRNLSRSENGTFVFTQNGELYSFEEGGLPKKIFVSFSADFNVEDFKILPVKSEATEIAVSPNGKEIAFCFHGEIFVSAVDGSRTRRITETPYREAMISFSPDGSSLIFSAENGSSWDIYSASIANKTDIYFYAATTIKIVPLIKTDLDEFKGVYSPDGKSIAYLSQRNILKVYNIGSKNTVTVSPEGLNYSTKDGSAEFKWSPDSKHLLISSKEGYSNGRNIILLRADGTGARIKLTQSAFNPTNPQWAQNGKMVYYNSYKNGLAPLSQGDAQSDIFATFLDQSFYDSFKLTREELALSTERKENDSIPPSKKETEKESLNADLLARRTIRLTNPSGFISDFRISKDNEKLYYLIRYESNYNLWVNDTRTHESKLLTNLDAANVSMEMGNDDKTLFILADGKIKKIDTKSGASTNINIDSRMEINAQAERKVIFEHVYSALPKRFIDPKLNGTNWSYYHDQYVRFLPYVNNIIDFQILLSEFLGELNVSHTGSGIIDGPPRIDQTAALGLLYQQHLKEEGIVVSEILKGSPFDQANSKMKKGAVIDSINDVKITAETDLSLLLNNKSGKYIAIGFSNPGNGVYFKETVKAISQWTETADLLYKRWVMKMEYLTDSLSGGKVGYVHIPEMNEESLRNTIDGVDGKNQGKKAIIIDTRFNSGGNIHEELNSFLIKQTHFAVKPQGQLLLQDALSDGRRNPTCVLISEGNYSDAYNFPLQYQRMGIGKLIGTPVAGTGSGVFWETQIDEKLYVGFPIVGLSWQGEQQIRENQQLNPDIKVYNRYEQILNGRDEQLEAAVKQMLKEIK